MPTLHLDLTTETEVVAYQNRHPKHHVVLGVTVLVCDNLCFSGEIEVKRRHTLYVQRDLPPMIESSIDKLLLGGIIAG